jgi:SSS family solute:Na+ symporter
MDAGLFIVIMAGLSVIYLALGWSLSHKMKDRTDFFLAGRNLGTIPVTASLLATQIGGGMFIGTTQDPIRGMLYIFGIVISFIVLGLGISEKFRDFEIETLPSIFEKQYNSMGLTRICVLLSVVTLGGILVTQAIAMQTLINGLTGNHLEYVFPALWTIIVLYTLLGGLKAVVTVDIVQVSIVFIIFILFFFKSLWFDTLSFFSIDTFKHLHNFALTSNISWAEVIHIILISSCYSIITQDIAHRLFAAKDRKVASRSTLYASFILLFFAIIPFYFGTKAHILAQLTGSESSLFKALSLVTKGPMLILALCALMAAITSTVDSLLCAISSIVSFLFMPFVQKKHELFVSQGTIVICGAIIFIASYHVPHNIISVLVESYQISVACLFVPIMFACFKKKDKLKKLSGYLAVLGGLSGLILSKLVFASTLAAWTLPIALSLSLLGYLLSDHLSFPASKKPA